MLQKIRSNYTHTIYASYIGYITQAVVNNFAPLLFLTFASGFSLSLDKITFITTINFAVQLLVDLICTRYIDKFGYRRSVIVAHICAALGLVGMAVLPDLLPDPYIGLLVAVILYAIGGGIIEVLISPIVEACPTEKKEAAMSLLHSFYCWGHVFVVVASTLFFQFAGISNWKILACLWGLIPLVNVFYFMLVPIYPIVAEHEKLSLKGLLSQKTFWLIFVLMICAGASEQGMSQWASTFAESALHMSKTMGDLFGVCLFALFMGTSRAIYGNYSEKIPLKKMIVGSSVLCIACYLVASLTQNPYLGLAGCALCGFSVGIFWPGTFSVAAIKIQGGGTAMYALLALAGDLGCSGGPTVVGLVSSAANGNLKTGLLAGIVFPVILLFGISRLNWKKEV